MKEILGISMVEMSTADLKFIEAVESDMRTIYNVLGIPKHLIPNKRLDYKMVRKIIRDKRFSRPIVYYKKVIQHKFKGKIYPNVTSGM